MRPRTESPAPVRQRNLVWVRAVGQLPSHAGRRLAQSPKPTTSIPAIRTGSYGARPNFSEGGKPGGGGAWPLSSSVPTHPCTGSPWPVRSRNLAWVRVAGQRPGRVDRCSVPVAWPPTSVLVSRTRSYGARPNISEGGTRGGGGARPMGNSMPLRRSVGPPEPVRCRNPVWALAAEQPPARAERRIVPGVLSRRRNDLRPSCLQVMM